MNHIAKRNRLMPWYIGIVIIFLAVIYVGYQMYATDCGIPSPLAVIALVIMPIVYIGLMYLTFTSQG